MMGRHGTPGRRGLFKFKTTTMQYNPRFNPGDQVYVMCENEIRKTTIREIRFYKDGTHHYCIDDPANEPNRAGLIVVGGDLAGHPMEIAKSLLNPYIFLGASISDLPSATVIFEGDPGVGIFPRYCNIELPFDLKDLSDEEREQAREAIQKLYAELDNDERPASVYFSDETEG